MQKLVAALFAGVLFLPHATLHAQAAVMAMSLKDFTDLFLPNRVCGVGFAVPPVLTRTSAFRVRF